MKIALQQNLFDGLKGNAWIIILSIVLIYPFIIVIGSFGDNLRAVIAVIAFPLILLALFNFRIIYSINILLLFINFAFLKYSGATIFISVLLVSFLINFKNIELKDFSNPLIFPFLFYLILCIPSLLYTDALSESLYAIFNLVAFVIVILLSAAGIKRVKELKNYIIVFLAGALINGIYIILEGILTQQRAFGFSGVMYVDFAGIAFIIVLLLAFFLNDSSRLFAAALTLFFALVSIFTQTRNTWLAIFATFIALMFYLIKNASFFRFNRRVLIIISIVSFLFLGAGVFALKTIKPEVFERTEEFTKSNKEMLTQEGQVTSSLVSRFFIWQTAANAFVNNPWTGVGIYAFPYVSQKYYTIPDFLFEIYVKRKTPHVAYLAVLTETGIIGLFGFLIFIYFMLKTSFGTIKLADSRKEKILTLILTWPIVYITISMFMTDAWLWQRGMISWGMFLGMNLSYRKQLLAKKTAKE